MKHDAMQLRCPRGADKGAMQNNMMADTLHLTTKFLSRVSILTSDIDIGIMSVRP